MLEVVHKIKHFVMVYKNMRGRFVFISVEMDMLNVLLLLMKFTLGIIKYFMSILADYITSLLCGENIEMGFVWTVHLPT